MAFIAVRHNIEVAHRLSQQPGNKCENIHGHSMWVELRIQSSIDHVTGMLRAPNESVFEFGKVKKAFRAYLDGNFDHHLLLNEKDPWANLVNVQSTEEPHGRDELPGLTTLPADPTTENIAAAIARWAALEFETDTFVEVAETHVNKAGVMALYQPDTGQVFTK